MKQSIKKKTIWTLFPIHFFSLLLLMTGCQTASAPSATTTTSTTTTTTTTTTSITTTTTSTITTTTNVTTTTTSTSSTTSTTTSINPFYGDWNIVFSGSKYPDGTGSFSVNMLGGISGSAILTWPWAYYTVPQVCLIQGSVDSSGNVTGKLATGFGGNFNGVLTFDAYGVGTGSGNYIGGAYSGGHWWDAQKI